jgi:hypothetical protein
LSLEIWRSSDSEWLFIFTIKKHSKIHQEKVHFASKSMCLSNTCPGRAERAERCRVYYACAQSKYFKVSFLLNPCLRS